MTILHDHAFLRSDFHEGTLTRKTGGASQQRRLANIPKYIQGLGCRVHKDVAQDGRGWLIINDGTSDVPLPPGFEFPGGYNGPFKVTGTGTGTVEIGQGYIEAIGVKGWNWIAASFTTTADVSAFANGQYIVGVQLKSTSASPASDTGAIWIVVTADGPSIFTQALTNGNMEDLWKKRRFCCGIITIAAGKITVISQRQYGDYSVQARPESTLYKVAQQGADVQDVNDWVRAHS